MFQRQLSTNTLNSGAQSASSSGGQGQGRDGQPKANSPGPRLFQRQMTASQLFSGSSSAVSSVSGGQESVSSGAGRRLLANVRGADPSLANSTACLASASGSATAAAASAKSQKATSGAESADGVAKKPTKNKRIISRMLSISAIQTSVGLNSSSSNSGSNNAPTLTGHDHHDHHHQHQASTTTGAGTPSSTTTTGYSSDDTTTAEPGQIHHRAHATGSDYTTDKFSDSSFTRSRSSSSSSTTANQQQQQQQQQQQPAFESIQCISFLDPAKAGAPQATLLGSSCFHQLQSSQQTGASNAQSSGSAGANHKSLCSIEKNSGGQLAFWLGTSNGNVLLVNLTLPDNEDNRILQLQSINTEPIPQASVKLSGQILSLMAFVCEPRFARSDSSGVVSAPSSSQLGAGSTTTTAAAATATTSSAVATTTSTSSSSGHHHNQHHQQLTSNQSSSLESAGVSPEAGSSSSAAGHCASSSLAGGGGAVASSGGAPTSGSGSSAAANDSRSALFFVLVSQKQARVFQVPANAASWSPAAQVAPSSSSTTAPDSKVDASRSHHHHHQHHHAASASNTSSSPPSQLAESPLCKLLVNKRNLFAQCDLSDTSFACHSEVVRWRSPDECCLVTYLATGNITVHSLPRLKPILYETDFVPYSSVRIVQSMRFSKNGHCLYQPSPGEICKFTLSSGYKSLVNEMLGLVHVPREMPEQPRANFFKSLFSVSQASKQSDRDELFGECASGKAARSVAKHLGSSSGSGSTGNISSSLQQQQQQQQSSSGLDKLKSAAVGSMGHEMRMAREGLDERGERLGELEDRTLNMLNQSETYSQAAHQLAQKFKDKKWYQF